jgi:hypothetical protein
VDWLEVGCDEAPVGMYAPVDGFWLDEIPWNVFEKKLPSHWLGIQDLVTEEVWTIADSSLLTRRQCELLKLRASNRSVNWDFLSQSQHKVGQVQTPLLRFNINRNHYERLESIEFALGKSESFGLGVVEATNQLAETGLKQVPSIVVNLYGLQYRRMGFIE